MGARALAGHRTVVSEVGQGPRRAVLAHCSLARQETLIPLARLMGEDWSSQLFDMPGHGRAADWEAGAGEYQLKLAEMMAALGPAVMLGHSFGATGALRAAVEFPDRVEALVLIEPVFFAAAAETNAYRRFDASQAEFIAATEAGKAEAMARAFTAVWGTGEPWEAMPARARAEITARIHLIPPQAPSLYEDIGGVLPRLSEVGCPVHLIRGERSPPIIEAIHAGLMARMPQAVETVIPGAGHMAPITHAGAVARAIREAR